MPTEVKALKSFRYPSGGGKWTLAELGNVVSVPNTQVNSLLAQGLIEVSATVVPTDEPASEPKGNVPEDEAG